MTKFRQMQLSHRNIRMLNFWAINKTDSPWLFIFSGGFSGAAMHSAADGIRLVCALHTEQVKKPVIGKDYSGFYFHKMFMTKTH